MPSKIQVDQIAGATGSTVTLPSGQTLDLSSGTVNLPSASLSALNASNLTSGTVPSARLILTSSDLPTVPTTKGGTGLTTIGTAAQVLRVNSGATALEYGTVSGSVFGTALLHIRDEKADGTVGGSPTSGSFITRVLNTIKTNEISGASLSSNQITLPSGTYYLEGFVPTYSSERNIIKLRNVTDSSDTLQSQNTFVGSGSGANVNIRISGRFTIAAQKTFEIQHRTNFNAGTEGFGVQMGFGFTEIYSDIQIWKVA